MNRQFRRRIAREWNKIRLGKPCTKFVERNRLFAIPYVIYFQAIKVCDDLICVYIVATFGFKEGLGYLALGTVCQFIDGLFRNLGSVAVGFVSEEDLEEGEGIEC